MVSTRIGLRQVCRPTNKLKSIDFPIEVHLIPNMIAQGDRIHSSFLDLVGRLRGYPRPSGSIFAIGKDQIGIQRIPNFL